MDVKVGRPRKPKETPPVPDFVEPVIEEKVEPEPVIQNLSSHPGSSPSISQISLEESPTVNSPVQEQEPEKEILIPVEIKIEVPKPQTKKKEVKIIPREVCEKFVKFDS